MSKEREEISVGKVDDMQTQLLGLDKKARRARLAQVLDRGYTEVRLRVALPGDVHGEWVHNDPTEIHRLQSMGFKVDDKYAVNNTLHSDGTNKPIIGDVIFMTCPMEIKEDIDAIARIKFVNAHGSKQEKKDLLAEEESYTKDVSSKLGMPTIGESKTHTATGAELEASAAGVKLTP